MNPIRWIDRLLFAVLLLITLQLPILSDHYRQYLSGYVNALDKQVEGWKQLAKEFRFSSVDDFIRHLESNEDAVVAGEATQKRATLAELEDKREGLAILTHGNYPQHVAYMFAPSNIGTLNDVLENFKPSLPLTPIDIVYSVVLAIVLDAILLLPFWGARRMSKRRLVTSA